MLCNEIHRCLRPGMSTPAMRAMLLYLFLSALTLLVARVLAQHADHALAAHDLALVTNLLDARSNLHVVVSRSGVQGRRLLILPRVGSSGEISISTRSPGITLTVVCLATPP